MYAFIMTASKGRQSRKIGFQERYQTVQSVLLRGGLQQETTDRLANLKPYSKMLQGIPQIIRYGSVDERNQR
jgi:hypothetical protein